jgi:ABC-type multidrug transport system fused ATPase/permease subunit
MLQHRSQSDPALPALWAGGRRRHLVVLGLAGLAQALVAGLGAHFLVHALGGRTSPHRGLLFAILVAAAAVVGLLRLVERVVSERLSQDYVHELRLGLIRRSLQQGATRSLGVTVARTTNDLSSVKTWVAQGVAPLAVDIPLAVGACVVLLLLDPVFGVALLAPLTVLLIGLRLLSPVAYERSRAVRRARGRLAAQIADTVLSTTAIRSAGGSGRELNRVDRLSRSLVDAAVRRAHAAGALRGLAAGTAALSTASIIGAGVASGLPAATMAAAVTVAGFLAVPMNDLGRVAEFRQTYRAARRIIGPAVELPAGAGSAGSRAPAVAPSPGVCPGAGEHTLVASGLRSGDGTAMAGLTARPGDRVVLHVDSDQQATALLDQLAGLAAPPSGWVSVAGTDLYSAPRGTLRRLVGYGARGMMLTRTSIERAVCYRSARTSPAESARLLALVGLAERVRQLPRGERTMLTGGGAPLAIPERGRLILARALFDSPPLLVFDHLDADLGREGRATMRQLLLDYPGVVVVASDAPGEIITPTRVWGPERSDGLPATAGRRSSPAGCRAE